MRNLFNHKIFGTVFGLIFCIGTLIVFQNCANPKSSEVASVQQAAGGGVFVAMTGSNAQTMAMGYEAGGCNALVTVSSMYTVLPSGSSLTASLVHEHQGTLLNSISGSGSVTIFGSGPNPGVNLVNNFSGNLLLCGFSLGQLEGGTGNVGIQNGSLDSIANFNGNIVLLGSDAFPSSIINFNGNIVIKNSSGQYLGRSYVGSK